MSEAILGKGDFIAGEFLNGSNNRIESHNPANNFLPVFCTTTTVEHVDLALHAANKALRPWSSLSNQQRIDALMRLK